ncbi:MAG: glycerophosphoryl diester phosphodiesterase membrane domain-containing protein [Microbacterium sp.]
MSQAWTPAPKKGAIPLHPLTFGMLLGRPFSALRHNPKVLLGFACAVQLVSLLVVGGVMTLVLAASFARLSSVSPGSDDFSTIQAGTIAINIVAGIVLGLATLSLNAVMQGIVAAEISFAAVGRTARLGVLWRKVRPSLTRLIGYALLQAVAVIGLFAIAVGVILAVGMSSGFSAGTAIAFLTVFLLLLLMIPAMVWLGTKLLLVPSILVLERESIRGALVRSWRLTRGRFWVALGVIFLISVIMSFAANAVAVPGMFVSMLLVGTLAPTGSSDVANITSAIVTGVLPQVLVFALQAVAVVVQCAAATLIYIDARMRYEALDQTLIAFTERDALGWTDEQLGDPYRVDPARAVTKDPPPRPQAPAYGYGYAPGAAGYPAAGYYGAPGQPAGHPAQGYPTQGYPVQGYPVQGYYPTQPYSTQGYPAGPQTTTPYPSDGHPTAPYPTETSPTSGYPTEAYPTTAYPTAYSTPPSYSGPAAPPAPPRGQTGPGAPATPPPAGPTRPIPPASESPWAAPGGDE